MKMGTVYDELRGRMLWRQFYDLLTVNMSVMVRGEPVVRGQRLLVQIPRSLWVIWMGAE